MKKLTMLLAIFGLLMGVSIASAQNGASNEWEEICFTTYNPCCDEYVEVCYDVHWRWDKDGYLTGLNAQGKGTGESGTNYVMLINQQQSYNVSSNGAYNATVTATQKYVATGNSDCDLILHYTLHVTVNANGETTAEVENVRVECANGTDIY